MKRYYYSTQAFLEWCFNHYFYDATHFSWLAAPFFPYKLANPASSNPYELYGSLYRPWKDRDPFDYFLESKRLHVRKGIIVREKVLADGQASRLKVICRDVDQLFLYPVVYRVDVNRLDASRLDSSSGSASKGSREYLVRDLDESEFDLLFADYASDTDFAALLSGNLQSGDALDLLESRC